MSALNWVSERAAPSRSFVRSFVLLLRCNLYLAAAGILSAEGGERERQKSQIEERRREEREERRNRVGFWTNEDNALH